MFKKLPRDYILRTKNHLQHIIPAKQKNAHRASKICRISKIYLFKVIFNLLVFGRKIAHFRPLRGGQAAGMVTKGFEEVEVGGGRGEGRASGAPV